MRGFDLRKDPIVTAVERVVSGAWFPEDAERTWSRLFDVADADALTRLSASPEGVAMAESWKTAFATAMDGAYARECVSLTEGIEGEAFAACAGRFVAEDAFDGVDPVTRAKARARVSGARLAHEREIRLHAPYEGGDASGHPNGIGAVLREDSAFRVAEVLGRDGSAGRPLAAYALTKMAEAKGAAERAAYAPAFRGETGAEAFRARLAAVFAEDAAAWELTARIMRVESLRLKTEASLSYLAELGANGAVEALGRYSAAVDGLTEATMDGLRRGPKG